MADTEQSKAALIAACPSGSAAAITAQVLRDIIVSAFGGFAMIRVIDGAAAQAVTGSAAVLTAFNADGPEVGADASHATDRITVAVSGHYWVEFRADLDADSAGVYAAELAKNGSAEGTLKSICELEASGETRTLGFAGPVVLSGTDYVQILVSGPAANITVRQARLAVKRIA